MSRAGLATAFVLSLILPGAHSAVSGQARAQADLPQAQLPAVLPPEHLSWYGDPSAPDLSGVWVRVDGGATGPTPSSKEGWGPWPAPLKPSFAAIWNKRVADAAAGTRTDDPVQRCLPPGMPRYITGMNSPLLIIQTPGRVTQYRYFIPTRRIYLKGVKLPAPKDLENFFNGNSIGHYEGSDLVTEVAGMKDLPIDSTGVPHSDDLRITERYHRVDANTLRVIVTLTDPTAYTRPMTTTVTYKAVTDPRWEIEEFVCKPKTDYHPEIYVR